MKTRLLLALLLIFTGSQCFGQARRVTRGKASTSATTSRPSAKIINAFNELFENRYFFNYEANNSECDVVFKKANNAGNGSGLIVTPLSGQSQSFSYNITAKGNVYIKIDGIKMNKEKLTWNLTPEGFILENMFFQMETNPEKYNELINWDKNNTEEEMSTNDNVPDASSSNSNDNNKVYETVEQEPSFPGGINAWLAENIKYPVVAAENGVQGRVVVGFIV